MSEEKKEIIMSGIYVIVHKESQKPYIGSAIDIKGRWHVHRHLLFRNCHKNDHLQNAWNKYGPDAFEFKILEYCPKENLTIREQYWINFYDSSNSKKGYNICSKAGNTLGFHHSEETKHKLSLCKTKPQINNLCPCCGSKFIKNRRTQKFCSIKCSKLKHPILKKICTLCQVEFKSNRIEAKFCSRRCVSIVAARTCDPNVKIAKSCKYCCKLFVSLKSAKSLFCNRFCYLQYVRGAK